MGFSHLRVAQISVTLFEEGCDDVDELHGALLIANANANCNPGQRCVNLVNTSPPAQMPGRDAHNLRWRCRITCGHHCTANSCWSRSHRDGNGMSIELSIMHHLTMNTMIVLHFPEANSRWSIISLSIDSWGCPRHTIHQIVFSPLEPTPFTGPNLIRTDLKLSTQVVRIYDRIAAFPCPCVDGTNPPTSLRCCRMIEHRTTRDELQIATATMPVGHRDPRTLLADHSGENLCRPQDPRA